ncbi:hypothetical protein HPB48_021936 [Haemaphysalis longicornis]|uniref:BPTI/Kunitz inhibitor domain-containing protein n=1 Tax=Haemaphysalis longicornis TaxID=44386 RepID=A0A9J6GB32_HAELO|nr:hypothetical protein HPB48_021936 [Haemaphysalis longicornis]
MSAAASAAGANEFEASAMKADDEEVGAGAGGTVGGVPRFCSFRPHSGYCSAGVRRYYWDRRSSKCRQFHYNGRFGNSNNFATLAECRRFCDIRESRCKNQHHGSLIRSENAASAMHRGPSAHTVTVKSWVRTLRQHAHPVHVIPLRTRDRWGQVWGVLDAFLQMDSENDGPAPLTGPPTLACRGAAPGLLVVRRKYVLVLSPH